MKKITKLTKGQEEQLPNIVNEWMKFGLSTTTDRVKAESLVSSIYKEGGLNPPKKIIWCESPDAGYKKAKEILGDNSRPLPCYGSHDAHWLAFYSAYLEFGIDECKHLIPLIEMAKCSGWFFPLDDVCILTPNPIRLSLDELGRLHDEYNKAIEYPDGWGLYYINGISVNEQIVKRPNTLTIHDIDNERNVEVRRIMINRYGLDLSDPDKDHGVSQYIINSEAKIIHHDKWGTLYKKELSDDEDIVSVKVQNSTPELDGSYKFYWCRVPPTITTAHQAVAWTFGVNEQDYYPIVET